MFNKLPQCIDIFDDEPVEGLRFVLLNTETEELKQDEFLTQEDAQDINEKLAADGSEYRWIEWEEQEVA